MNQYHVYHEPADGDELRAFCGHTIGETEGIALAAAAQKLHVPTHDLVLDQVPSGHASGLCLILPSSTLQVGDVLDKEAWEKLRVLSTTTNTVIKLAWAVSGNRYYIVRYAMQRGVEVGKVVAIFLSRDWSYTAFQTFVEEMQTY